MTFAPLVSLVFGITVTALLFAIVVEVGWVIFRIERELRKTHEKLAATQAELHEKKGEFSASKAVIESLQVPHDNQFGRADGANAVAPDPELRQTLERLSTAISQLPMNDAPRGDSIAAQFHDASTRFQKATEEMAAVCGQLMEQLAHDRTEMSDRLSELVNRQTHSLDQLRDVLDARRPANARERATDVHMLEPDRALQLPESSVTVMDEPQVTVDTVPHVANKDDRFWKLREWVINKLPDIASRSLNQWRTTEELVGDVPRNLNSTSRLLDPASKLIVIGIEGQTVLLAIALPGGYIGSTFYEWFTIPKGTNVRVERTVTPATVEAGPGGFRVIERGVVAQD